MGRAKASISVPGRAADAEALWYDPHRWQAWVDGFGHVVSLDDGLAAARRASSCGSPRRAAAAG